MTYGLGTKQDRECYDGKIHECTITDCAVILSGRTFENKKEIKADGFKWWNDWKYWVNHYSDASQIDEVISKYKRLGVKVLVKPIFRITDTETNPIEA